MTPQTRQWISNGKTSLAQLAQRGIIFLKQLNFSNSADYQAWRHHFLLSRLSLCLKLALVVLLTLFPRDLYYDLCYTKQKCELSGETFLWLSINPVLAVLLFGCLLVLKTPFGRRYPIVLFLCLSWSTTIIPQALPILWDSGFNTHTDTPVAYLNGVMVFMAQATLMPVYWWLHLLSHLGVLFYDLGFYYRLGRTINWFENLTWFLSVFWFCAICNLGVYLYERLQRKEFESRRELRVFLHSVSHDLRTPVMGSLMVLQNLLKLKISEDKITVNRSVLEQMQQGSDRQLNLINSLLEAYTTETQDIVLHRQPCQLNPLVQSVLADLQPVLIKNQVILTNKITPELPSTNADSTQLWRVFSNLISNALKHNPPRIHLTLDAIVEAKNIRCSVRDNGVGMSQELCDRMFEPYTRGDRARYMPGFGIGLYLCRQIITAHGGEIGVISSPGLGSTFWFTLPLN